MGPDYCNVDGAYTEVEQKIQSLCIGSQEFVVAGSRWIEQSLVNPSVIERIQGRHRPIALAEDGENEERLGPHHEGCLQSSRQQGEQPVHQARSLKHS